MNLADFQKPAPPVSVVGTVENPPASGEAPQEEQYNTVTTPSGIEIYYSWAPRRHYKLRHPGDAPLPENYTEVPSVTNVLGVLDKSGPLVWWAQGVTCEAVIALSKRGLFQVAKSEPLVPVGVPATKENLVDLITAERLSVNHQRDSAADRGVNVHDSLERWVAHVKAGRELYPEVAQDSPEYPYVQGLRGFLAAITPATDDVQSELMVGSLQHSYAGRFDLVLTLSKPVGVVTKIYPKRKPRVEEIPAGRYLLDLKTSKGIYNTHYLQLEAYEAAAVECGYEPTDHRGVIHVTADGRYELALNKDWTFDDFLAVRRCFAVMNERSVVQALRNELDAKDAA